MSITEGDYFNLRSLINDAALTPDLWMDVLKELARVTGCIAGGLTIEDAVSLDGNPVQYFGFDTGHVEKTWHHYLPMNPLIPMAPTLQPGSIVTNGMVIPEKQFKKTDFYNGWAKPQDLCSPVTLILHRSGSVYVPLTLVRPDGSSDVDGEALDLLSKLAQPLIRAFDVTMRLKRLESREEAYTDALLNLPFSVLVLDEHGAILRVNIEAERLLAEEHVLAVRGGFLSARIHSAFPLVEAIKASDRQNNDIMEVIIGREGRRPLIATVLKSICENGFELPVRSRANIVVIVDPERSGQLRSETFVKAYKITAAETRVLDCLLEGSDLKEAAESLKLTRETVRSHLKSIFSKTEVKRQSELMRLASMTRSPFAAG